MEKQKIFLLVIAVGALFILLQQGSQMPNNHYLNKSPSLSLLSYHENVSKSKLYEDKMTNDLLKSTSRFVHKLSKTFHSNSETKKRKERLRSWIHKYNFIDRFKIYDGVEQSRILILAYFRSGSSFLGDLLQQNWKSFYTFEPLHYMTRQTRINDSNIIEALTFISNIYNCDFEANTPYIKWIKNNTFLVRWNHFFWNVCKFSSLSLCFDNNFLGQVCMRSKYNIIKTVRLKIKDLEQLLTRMGPTNLKVIYLVRDPRGIYNSRKSMEWCNNDECSNITNICIEMRQDLQDYDRLKSSMGKDLVIARYEDISLDPVAQAKQLFKGINLEFSPSVERFLRTHTKSYKEKDSMKKNPYSTYRANSSSTAMQWTKELNSSEIEFAQQVCQDILQRLNYNFLL